MLRVPKIWNPVTELPTWQSERERFDFFSSKLHPNLLLLYKESNPESRRLLDKTQIKNTKERIECLSQGNRRQELGRKEYQEDKDEIREQKISNRKLIVKKK